MLRSLCRDVMAALHSASHSRIRRRMAGRPACDGIEWAILHIMIPCIYG